MKGIYINNGRLEFDVPELLDEFGLEHTEANKDKVIELATNAAIKSGMLHEQAKIETTHKHKCFRCRYEWIHKVDKKKCFLPVYSHCPQCRN